MSADERRGAHDPASLGRIGPLAAVARGLEREGAYNGAKLVRAVLERELTRYAEAAAPVGLGAGAAALRALRGELAGLLPAPVLERMDVVAAHVAAGETVTLGEVPAIRVCRVCGELFLDAVPLACPACEAPALSFREILPAWYLEPAEPGTVLAALAAGPGHLARALSGRTDEALDRAPAPGEWSARATLSHLAFSERLLRDRIARLLAEDEPELVAWNVAAGPPPSDERSDPPGERASELAARYRSLRHETVEQLRPLDDAGWGRAGTHPEWGRVTVLSQAAYFARHEASHLAQLVAAAEGRLPGGR